MVIIEYEIITVIPHIPKQLQNPLPARSLRRNLSGRLSRVTFKKSGGIQEYAAGGGRKDHAANAGF